MCLPWGLPVYSAIAGLIALTDVIPGMRAISSINLLKNQIPVEQAQELVKIMRAKEKLVTLCGLRKEETELDLSGQPGQTCLGAGDAVLIANDIHDMGVLTSLNLSSNFLTGIDGDDMSGNMLNPPVHDVIRYTKPIICYPFTGVTALANAIPDMRALTSLNLSSNDLEAEGAKVVAEAIKVI
jgi:hypothetical protein